MTTRVKHNMDLPKIALAIQEYKTTPKTQRQCAAEFGIPYKLFSYYYLNGFKKNQKVGGAMIPTETQYKKKSKQRQNNYDVILVGGNVQNQSIPNEQHVHIDNTKRPHDFPAQDMQSQSHRTKQKSTVTQSVSPRITDKIKAATIIKNGKKHVDLDKLMFDA